MAINIGYDQWHQREARITEWLLGVSRRYGRTASLLDYRALALHTPHQPRGLRVPTRRIASLDNMLLA